MTHASITPELAKKVEDFIKSVLEPKINAIVDSANSYLNKHGAQVGVEIQWYVDKYESEKLDVEED